MNYRLLNDEEKAKLAEVFPQYDGVDLSGVTIAGAVDDSGQVRGLAVLNYAPHCEPVWIEPGVQVDFRRLARVVEEQVVGPELWVFAPNEHVQRMAEICGGVDTGWKVMRKELN